MIRPLIETLAVQGHFLSMYLPNLALSGVLNPSPMFLTYLFGLVLLSLRSFLVLKKTAS